VLVAAGYSELLGKTSPPLGEEAKETFVIVEVPFALHTPTGRYQITPINFVLEVQLMTDNTFL